MKKIRKNLKIEIIKSGLTNKALADIVGCSPQRISNIIAGMNNTITMETAIAIKSALNSNMELEQLFENFEN